jgi:hypothetical protein
MSLNDDELNDIRQLIDNMQSGLVELFEQLRELRERLNMVSELPTDSSPSILPLFSQVTSSKDTVEITPPPDTDTVTEDEADIGPSIDHSLQEIPDDTSSVTSEDEPSNPSSVNAKVSRVLDPITRELRTGEATANIILEYLETAKEYLIDDDERKKKVARDMDIVLNFLKARGKRGIRTEERDNILKRIRRWKAHLVSYSSSPAE